MRIGILTDIHEDITSLKQAILYLEKSNCTELVCLGDITGFDKRYYRNVVVPDASGCISVIRNNCKYVVIGNHDLYNISKIPEVFSKMNLPGNWYELDLRERKKMYPENVWLYNNEIPSLITTDSKEYLSSLPEFLIVNFNGHNVFFSHSIYPDLTGSIVHRPYNPWDLQKHFHLIKQSGCMTGLSGHMHPRGILHINYRSIKLLSFGIHKIENECSQYFSPCLANNSGKTGFLILETEDMTIEAVRLISNNKKWFGFYEKLYKKYKP